MLNNSLNASVHHCHHCLSLLNTLNTWKCLRKIQKTCHHCPAHLRTCTWNTWNCLREAQKTCYVQRMKLCIYFKQYVDVLKASGAPVSKLFNQSILTGCFPMMWKRSNIVPIPKNGDKTNPANYKPISLLPILSNFRRGILWTSCYILDSQCSFQSGKSTVTALLETTHNWFKR